MMKRTATNTRFEQANYFLEGSAFGVADNSEYFWNEEDSDKELWNDEEKSAEKKNKDNAKQAKDKSEKLDESSTSKEKTLKAAIDKIQDYITGAGDDIAKHKKSGNDALLTKATNKMDELKSRLTAAKKKLNDHIKATSEEIDECTAEKTKSLKKYTTYAESVISAAKEDATLCEALLKNFGEVSIERVATKILKEMDQKEVQNSLRSIYMTFKKNGTIPEVVTECADSVEECNNSKELEEDAGTDAFEYVYDSFLNGDYEPMMDEISDSSRFGQFVSWVANVAKASDETLSELVRQLAHKIR